MHHKFLNLILLTCLFTLPQKLAAQTIETFGIPFIETFSPKEFGASEYTWAILQNKEGIIFVGNNNGLLTFDGTDW